MSRAGRATLIALAPGLALLLACGGRSEVATYRVERRPFVHKVGAEGVLEAEKTTVLTVPPEVEETLRLAWIAPAGTVVAAGDVVARFDRRPMEERLADGRSELRSTDLSETRATSEGDARVIEIATEREVAELELALAQRFQKDDADVFSRHEILESQIDEGLARERRRHAEGAAQTQERLSAAELALLAIRRGQASQRIDQAEKALASLEVAAPHAGLFLPERDWRGEPLTPGAEMWRGQPVGEIPDLATMSAEVYVLEADAGGVAVGKLAEVVVEARPDRVFAGKVRRVDPVAQPRFRGSPVQYFGVGLSLDEVDAEVMKPGQRVRATLYLERDEAVLVVPRQAIVRDGGKARVFVRDGAGFTPREVEIAASSMGLAVIATGVEEGEVIALRPPDAGPGEAPGSGPDDGNGVVAPSASVTAAGGG